MAMTRTRKGKVRVWDPHDDNHPDNMPVGKLKQWPESGTVYYEDLMDPLLKIFRANYTRRHRDTEHLEHCGERRRWKKYRKVVYNGYNIGKSDLAGIPNPAENLNPAGLRYHEMQGRELYHVLFNIAFLLGIEQGRRDCAERRHSMIELEAILRNQKVRKTDK
jgi:hypothetical protein